MTRPLYRPLIVQVAPRRARVAKATSRVVAWVLAGLVAGAAAPGAAAPLPPLIPPPDVRGRAASELAPAGVDVVPSAATALDAAPLAVAPPMSPEQQRLRVALERFEFGDYAGVVAELESLVPEHGEISAHLDRVDRLEALRAYGIACVLVGRATAAEGAFLLLLDAEPGTRLDLQLVRPEAVALFEAVRLRRGAGLLAAYRKGRGRRYAVLNLLPPAGQLQNKEYKKGYTLLGLELGLLGLNIVSGSLLYTWRGDHQDFPGHEDAARALRPVNWVSFGGLIAVVLYGIVDGFVVGHRRGLEERAMERDTLRAERPRARAQLDLSSSALGLRF